MSDTNIKIIELIKQNYSMKTISYMMNMSEKQLYVRIKQIIDYGYNIKPSYDYNSDIYYKITSEDSNTNFNVSISLPRKQQKFKCLVISDLHIGNRDSDLSLLKRVYDYASKNSINYIFICGDNIEGDYTSDVKRIKSVENQSDILIKKYPYDENIKNIMIFGNHDFHAFKHNGFDLSKKIKNSRYDMIPIGYGQGSVKIGKDSILLFHKLRDASTPTILNDEKIILSGHGHMMKTKVREQLWICAPTLSYVSTDKTKEVIPGFIELNIEFDRARFDYIDAKHIIITPKLINISETKCKIKSLKL